MKHQHGIEHRPHNITRVAEHSVQRAENDVIMQDFSQTLPGVENTVLSIILGGGAGTRLYPLTKKRAKPAVPLGCNYRLIDIPVSNCLNSNINKIYCLTQVRLPVDQQTMPPGTTAPVI